MASVKLYLPRAQVIAEVDKAKAVTWRAESTAASFDRAKVRRLESKYERAPQVPADAHLSATIGNMPDEWYDDMIRQYEEMGVPPVWGEKLNATQLRYLLASEEDAETAYHRVEAVMGYMHPEAWHGRMLGALGTGVKAVASPLTYVDDAIRLAPGGTAFLDANRKVAGAVGGAVWNAASKPMAATYEGVKAESRGVMPFLEASPQAMQAYLSEQAADADQVVSGDVVGGLRGSVGNASRLNALAPGVNLGEAAETLWDRRGDLADAVKGVSSDPLGALGTAFDVGSEIAGDSLWAQTDLGQTQAYMLDKVGDKDFAADLGDGFFFNDGSAPTLGRKEAERSMGTLQTVRGDIERQVNLARGIKVGPDGQTYTFGRGIASSFALEQDSVGYNFVSGLFDAAIAIGAPGPEDALAGALLSSRAFARGAAGGVNPNQFTNLAGSNILNERAFRSYDIEGARSWVQSSKSDDLVDYFVSRSGDKGFGQIWRATQGKMEPDVAAKLVEAKTPEQVRFILDTVARTSKDGLNIRSAPGRLRGELSNALGDTAFMRNSGLRRLRGLTPADQVDFNDPRGLIEFTYAFARQTKAPDEVADSWARQMASASNNMAAREVYHQITGTTMNRLVNEFGIPLDRAAQLTRYTSDLESTTRIGLEDMLLMSTDEFSRSSVDALQGQLPSIHLMSQAASTLPTPNYRELRRATSWARPLYETVSNSPASIRPITNVVGPLYEGVFDMMMWGQTRWKQFQLLRAGYPLRTWVTEEPLRMLVNGQTGFSHPAGVFGALLSKQTRVGDAPVELTQRVRIALQRNGVGETVEMLMSRGARRNTRALDNILNNPQFIALRASKPEGTSVRNVLREFLTQAEAGSGLRAADGGSARHLPEFQRAMMDERLGGLNREVGSGVRRGAPGKYWRDEIPDRIAYLAGWEDEIMDLANDVVAQRVARDGSEDTYQWLVGDGATVWERLKTLDTDTDLGDPIKLREYLDMLSRELPAVTGGNDDLLGIIQQGKWTKSLKLDDYIDYGPEVAVARNIVKGDEIKALDRWINGIFDAFQTRPSNSFRRAPTFMHHYEYGLVELAPLVSEKDIPALLAMAKRMKVTTEAFEVIQKTAKGEGLLTASNIDELARYGALQETKNLLFDTTMSSNFFDQMRLMSPFGEAWREVVTTWGRLFTQNPFILNRQVGQVAQGVQSEEFGQVYAAMAGLDRDSDEGFFYENEHGDLVFYYPYSRDFTQWLTSMQSADIPFSAVSVPVPGTDNGSGGVAVRMEGSLQGMNIAGEVFPGLGVYSGLMANDLIPPDPRWDTFRDILLPYGEPGSLLDLTTYLPSWARTAIKGSEPMTPEQLRIYGNTQIRVLRYLFSTGNYADGQDGYNRALAHAKEITPNLFFARAVVQFGAPSSPQVASELIGPDGELISQATVIAAYRKFQEQDPSMALELMLEEWGVNIAPFVTQGSTVNKFPGGAPTDAAGYDWVRENPEVAENHRELHGLFAPIGEGSEFSYDAYLRSIDDGGRIVLTPEEWLRLSNNRLGATLYRNRLAQWEGPVSDEEQAMRDTYKQYLIDQYPGYTDVDGIGNRAKAADLINRGLVERTLDDPVLAATPAGVALGEYWRVREQLLVQAEAAGVRVAPTGGWRTSNDGAPYRTVLRNVGEDLVLQEPEFARMWDMFLSQEFKQDEEE